MWYVVQVRSGAEENMRRQSEKLIPKTILEQCFIPYYEEKKHMMGEWKIQKKILFPGYIFTVSENIDALFEYLKKVDGLTKLLGTGQEIVALGSDEIEFLKRFGGTSQVVTMSEGIIINSKVKINSGPLKGMEGFIKKIDRHKRKAWLELPMFGRIQKIQVGIEITEKITLCNKHQKGCEKKL